MREEIFTYIKKKYKVSPEYPWGKYENNAVFRHSDNQKWFALVMEEISWDFQEMSGWMYST